MNAEQVELARRFVACKGWVWLPGMAAASKHEDEQGGPTYRIVHVYRGGLLAFSGWVNPLGEEEACGIGLSECVPDISDALTRAGLLEVVRRAWGCHVWTAPYVQWTPDGDVHWFMAEVPVAAYYDAGRARFNGPSELHALLAALEAAP